jgi:hypothetical protein
VTGLRIGLHIGQHVQAFMPGHGQGAHLARLDMGQGRVHLIEVHGNLVAQHVVDGRSRATVGNVVHFGARALEELGAPHMADGAVAGVA